MEIRTFVLSVGLACGGWFPVVAGAVPVKRYPLDDRATFAIRVGTDAPTTIMFPDPITALDGMNLSLKPEDAPPVLLSHRTGTNYLSVRALRPDAAAAVNVIVRGRVVALTFTAGPEPDRTVTFTDEPVAAKAEGSVCRSPARLLSLLDRAARYTELKDQYPALAQNMGHRLLAAPSGTSPGTSRLLEVFRFEQEDALVFRARLENAGDRPVRFEPRRLAVRVGTLLCPLSLTDATGSVPAHAVEIVWLVVASNPADGGAGLSLNNEFELVLPPLE